MTKAKATPKGTAAPASAPKAGGENLNTVALVGRLTADPISRTTPSGKSVSNFRIAVSQRGEQVSFQNVTVWGKLSEICAAHLSKGRLVSVAGRLDSRDWLAEDGTKRTSVTVTAWNIQFLDRPKAQAANGEVA